MFEQLRDDRGDCDTSIVTRTGMNARLVNPFPLGQSILSHFLLNLFVKKGYSVGDPYFQIFKFSPLTAQKNFSYTSSFVGLNEAH